MLSWWFSNLAFTSPKVCPCSRLVILQMSWVNYAHTNHSTLGYHEIRLREGFITTAPCVDALVAVVVIAGRRRVAMVEWWGMVEKRFCRSPMSCTCLIGRGFYKTQIAGQDTSVGADNYGIVAGARCKPVLCLSWWMVLTIYLLDVGEYFPGIHGRLGMYKDNGGTATKSIKTALQFIEYGGGFHPLGNRGPGQVDAAVATWSEAIRWFPGEKKWKLKKIKS